LAAFLRGQTTDSALQVVRQYLADNPKLPQDLRRKVLQHMDELERTVQIRELLRARSVGIQYPGRQLDTRASRMSRRAIHRGLRT
jgi:tRNA isopentenyl-2-thiomethyl-A-37 hydroxylase MiaE